MRYMFMICLLCIGSSLGAQTIDLTALRSMCVPSAPESTLRAIIHVESGGNPNAMQIDFPHALLKQWKMPPGVLRLKRQPKDAMEASQWLSYFQSFHVFVDVGLMQVSTAEAHRRGIPAASLLEPCSNLRVGWSILEDAYKAELKVYGPGETALEHAISRYNTGNTQAGIDNGYLGRVLAAAQRLNARSKGHQ